MKIHEHEKIEKDILVHKTRIFIGVFFTTLTLVIASIVIVYNLNKTYDQRAILKREATHVSFIEQHIHNVFRQVTSDLQILKSHHDLRDFLNVKSETNIENLTNAYISMSSSKDVYDQIRYIDAAGEEIIKVLYNNGRPEAVDSSMLQNKRDRYYFTNTMTISEDETFISPFDLNIEEGVIEKPIKPVIRLATPVFDSAGDKGGIVVLNFNGRNLLNDIEQFKLQEEGQLMLLDQNSYWLKGPTAEDEWGFMYSDTQNINFKNKYPEVWFEMNNKLGGQIYTDDGIFIFDTVFPLQFGQISSTGIIDPVEKSYAEVNQGQYSWKIVSFVSNDTIARDAKILLYYLLALSGILLIMMAYRTIIMSQLLSNLHLEEHTHTEEE